MAQEFKWNQVLLLGIALVVFGQAAGAQSGDAAVEGRVICRDGNVPARGARVQLVPLASLLPNSPTGTPFVHRVFSAVSDFNGIYRLSSIEPGTYIVNATMPGYEDELKLITTNLKRYSPDQQHSLVEELPQVVVKDGGSVRQDLVLQRGGAISGTVFVDAGGIMPQARVTATLVPSDAPGSAAAGDAAEPLSFSQFALTDDRGVYRVAGLIPGHYRLSVRVVESFFTARVEQPRKVTVVPQRTGVADLTVFAPEALEPADGKSIEVAEGDEIGNADITIPTRSVHSLAGIVTREGEPVGGVSISLERDGHRVQVANALSMPDGSFQFDLLPDGNYSVVAAIYSQGKATSSGKTPVQLHGSDVLDAVVDLEADAGKP